MDKADLKRIAVEAAMERVVGTSSVPARHLASLLKQAGVMIEEFRAERQASKEQRADERRQAQELESRLKEYARELARIRKIVGEKGEPGRDGKDGRDGRDGKEVDIDKVVSRILELIRVPKDGKDAIVDYETAARKAVELIFSEKLLKKEHISGLDAEMASYRSQLAGKHYGQDTWARGGGDTVSAGSNIVLVKKQDGTVQINALGGGSGTNVTTQYQLTAVAAGPDATIDLTQLTNWATFAGLIAVYQNNIMLTEGLNFTVAGNVVTVINGTDSDVYNATYAYA